MAGGLVTIRDDTLLRRLGTKFTVAFGDGCWEWTGGKDARGYGQIWCEGRVQYAHRVLYRLLVGEISDHAVLDHLCRNPACVRPAHLEPVHWLENIARGNKGGRKPKTHCPKGHELSGDNLRVHNGHRHCRTCNKASALAAYYRRKNN